MAATKGRWKRTFGYAGIADIPGDAKGVYGFWYSKTGRCLYIGMTDRSIRTRLTEHWKDCDNPVLKDWLDGFPGLVEICYLQLTGNAGRMEQKLIRKWHPEANVMYNRPQRRNP